MKKIRLIHWKPEQANEKVKYLGDIGYDVRYEPLENQDFLRRLKENPPDAFVIDLSRLPSNGRDVALALRQYKPTRYVPLVFVDGKPDKVERIKAILPDATYSTWEQISESLKHAIAQPIENPIVPKSLFDGYAGTPLPKKLGIKANSLVTLVNAPGNFKETLGELPENTKLRHEIDGQCELVIWFVKSRKDLEGKIDAMAKTITDNGGLWIAWQKKASGVASDLTQNDVRQVGLAAGLVDYKICSIDRIWSGLKFAHRKLK